MRRIHEPQKIRHQRRRTDSRFITYRKRSQGKTDANNFLSPYPVFPPNPVLVWSSPALGLPPWPVVGEARGPPAGQLLLVGVRRSSLLTDPPPHAQSPSPARSQPPLATFVRELTSLSRQCLPQALLTLLLLAWTSSLLCPACGAPSLPLPLRMAWQSIPSASPTPRMLLLPLILALWPPSRVCLHQEGPSLLPVSALTK